MSNANMDIGSDELLVRYFSGIATEEEVSRIYKWLDNNPDGRRELDFQADIWRRSPGAMVHGNADSVWSGITRRTGLAAPVEGVVHINQKRAKRPAVFYLAIAASLIIAIVGAKYLAERGSSPTLAQGKTYSTTTGQRASVVLTDGSEVILAPRTVMKVSRDGRNIELAGEAVFTVSSHNRVPFMVKAGGITTQVLGTTFGVQGYGDEVKVFVKEGKVSVGPNTLSAKDVAVARNGQITVQHDENIEELTAWVSNRLVFNDAPTSKVIAELGRWYDVELRKDINVPEKHVTASVEMGSLSEVLDLLAPALGVKYTRMGRVVELVPR